MGRLVFEYPYITTIPEQSNIMGIVGKKNKNWIWFLNHFIQLQVNRNTSYYLGLNFSYGDNYKLVKDNPLLETYSVPRDIIALYSTMGSFVKNAIDAGYFVYCSVDVFEIEAYKQYQLKHGNHDLMIIGYDLDGVDIVDFFNMDYCLKKCSFEQLEKGCNGFQAKRDNAGFQEIILLKARKDYVYTYHYVLLKNTEPCTLELLSIECNTTDTHYEKNFCEFDGTDTLTKGDWKSKYGRIGYDIASYERKFPFYMRVVYSNFADKVWKLSEKTDHGQALVVGGGEKIAACKSFEKEALIDMIITGNKIQKVSLYFMDCYTFDREISITMVDGDSLEVLDIQKVHVLNGGIYVSYKVRGHLLIKLQNCGKALGVISAIFVDEDCSCS